MSALSDPGVRGLLRADSGGFAEGPSLAELISVGLRRPWLVAAIVIGSAVAGYGVSFLFTQQYRAEAVVIPQTDSDMDRAMGSVTTLTGELGGLAALAGLDSMGSQKRNEAIEVLRPRATTAQLITQDNLMPILYEKLWDPSHNTWRAGVRVPSMSEAVDRFARKVRVITEDRRTGLLTLAVTWRDPQLASKWATDMIALVNARMRETAEAEADRTLRYLDGEVARTQSVEMQAVLYRLVATQLRKKLMAEVRDDYAFKVIDPATVPDIRRPDFPNRPLFVGLGVIFGLIVALIATMILAERDRRRAQSVRKGP
jgi:uncharacterized protein involved in exopolysaccharide biosynthesis